MPKKFIIITSIFPPTEAVQKFAKLADWQLIVVGDKKTPSEWEQAGVTFISAEDQENLQYQIIKKLPWNHYGRKMIGYLHAAEQQASLIADTDDDNIPYEQWGELPAGQLRSLSS